MRDIVLAVITRLKADPAVSGVVSTRVYRRNLPANPTFPAITVTRIDKKRDNQKSNTGRYADARIQCTAWASSDGIAEDLSELIADSLNRTVNTALSTGTTTAAVYVVSIFDNGGVPDENTDIPLYMEHRDFMIKYSYK